MIILRQFKNYFYQFGNLASINVNFCGFPQNNLKKKLISYTKLLVFIIFYLRKFIFLIQTVLRKFTFYYLILRKLTSNNRTSKNNFFTFNYPILRKFT